MLKIGSNKGCEQRDGERSKGGERIEKREKILLAGFVGSRLQVSLLAGYGHKD